MTWKRAASRFASASGSLGLALAMALAPSTAAEPAEPTALADPSARLPGGSAASEHWEITVRLDSGHWIMVRFIVTDFGPGDRNAVVLGHVVEPDGQDVLFSNGRFRPYWKLSDDRRRLDIGTSHLDLHEPLYRLFIDKDKARIDLRFAPQSLPSPPAGTLPEGYNLEVLALGARVTGTLQMPGMTEAQSATGHISMIHTWMSDDESELAPHRIEFHALADDALYVLDLANGEGRRWNWLLARNSDSNPRSLAGFETSLAGSLSGLSRPEYFVPAGIHWFGTCLDAFAALSRPLLQNDPLEALPQPMRWLVGLRIKPHRVWATSGFEVTLRACSNRPPIQMLGTGITTLTFMRP
ncbi:MAG: hypothetical protein VX574_06395 [Myxococcota bacterium]|nr:hypothetical protein [Myxococcota bacterium]